MIDDSFSVARCSKKLAASSPTILFSTGIHLDTPILSDKVMTGTSFPVAYCSKKRDAVFANHTFKCVYLELKYIYLSDDVMVDGDFPATRLQQKCGAIVAEDVVK